jgi:dTDP-4-amino-4,6-dideoxygalactose transaminase
MNEMNNRKRIYLSPPHMKGEEIKLVKKVFESNWIAPAGPDIGAFEREFALNNGSRYAAAVSSGTAALHLAMRILGIGKGDEVLCSSLTFCASATPVVFQGARPVFIDSDETSWNMDPGLLEEELKGCAKKGKLPKAVVVTHLYGQSADIGRIMKLCGKYGIPVIEDAAEALGALYKGKRVGNFGFAGVFSFNGNKIITTSSGGMLVSRDRKFMDRARFLATQARDAAPHYQHSEIGYNYRMSNVLAAIGRGQLRALDKRVKRKRAIFETYKKLLGDIPGISFMPEPAWSRGNRWLTCILVDPKKFGATREDIRLKLEEHNIESRPLWKPMHLQPVFKGCRARGGDVSKRFFERGLCLPSGTALDKRELDFIVRKIKSVH